MNNLVIVVTNNDQDVIRHMLIPYIEHALSNEAWHHISIVLWSKSIKWIVDSETLRNHFIEFTKLGVNVIACQSLSSEFAAITVLKNFGVEITNPSSYLTQHLKDDTKILTI